MYCHAPLCTDVAHPDPAQSCVLPPARRLRPPQVLGIDVSKGSLTCALYDRDSERFDWEKEVPNTAAGVERLLALTPETAVWVMEPTGRYSLTVAKQARVAGRKVLLAPTKKARSYLHWRLALLDG